MSDLKANTKGAALNWGRIRLWTLAIFVCYLTSYLINSYCGGYWREPVIGHGSNKYKLGDLGMPSVHYWQPYFGYRDNAYLSPMGIFYSPCILIDQHLIHPPLDLFDESDEAFLSGIPRNGMKIMWHSKVLPATKKR